MNNLQAMMNGMSAEWQRERAATQMTLGKLIDRLKELPADAKVADIGEPHSYRGYYQDLAFSYLSGEKMPVTMILNKCQAAMGEVFQGYKGGDYQMGRNTPVHIANYGCCGQKLMAILDDGTLELAEDE